jgi:hypothetical protein
MLFDGELKENGRSVGSRARWKLLVTGVVTENRNCYLQNTKILLTLLRHPVTTRNDDSSIGIVRIRGSVVVKPLCYKPEGRGFNSR